jgi:DNA-binding CsgD family transcriptional regulator
MAAGAEAASRSMVSIESRRQPRMPMPASPTPADLFGQYARSGHLAFLDIDCLSVSLAKLDGGAVHIGLPLYLDGELHESPETLRSHCASLFTIWAAVREPCLIDLGRCECIGRRIVRREAKDGRRFAVHAHGMVDDQALFVLASSTRRWKDDVAAKRAIAQLAERAHALFLPAFDSTRIASSDVVADVDSFQFTARENAILRLLAEGLSNKQIARQLGTSPNTVRNQIHAVFRKTGVSNRTELALRINAQA